MNNYQYIERPPSIEDWIKIRESISWSVEERKDFEIALQNTLYAVCVYNEDEMIGMGRVIGDNRLCFYIQDVVVLSEFQKQGIGHKIMYLILKYISLHASKHATVGLFSALGKESFYKEIGFISRPNKIKGCGMYIEPSTAAVYINQYPNYKAL